MATIRVKKSELAECFNRAIKRLVTEKKMDYRDGFNKASKRANRDMEQDTYGNGFKSYDKPHRSLKDYSRKGKNRFSMDSYEDDFDYNDDMVEEGKVDLSLPDDDQYYDDGYDTDSIPDIDDYVNGNEYVDSNEEDGEPTIEISTDIDRQEQDLINRVMDEFEGDVDFDIIDGTVTFVAPKSMASRVKKFLRSEDVTVY